MALDIMFQFEGNLNLSQRMTHELGKAIVRGEYKQSGGLPTEAELCDKFGISRSAMREAVKMLSAKGLIISRPRQGIRILPEDNWNIFDADVLKWILDSNPSLLLLKNIKKEPYFCFISSIFLMLISSSLKSTQILPNGCITPPKSL